MLTVSICLKDHSFLSQVKRALISRRNALVATTDAFSTLRDKLPALFPGISPYTTDGLPNLHPGLFACLAQIQIATGAIDKATKIFQDRGHLPSLPHIESTNRIAQQVTFILNGVFDPLLPIPSLFHLRERTIGWKAAHQGVEPRLPSKSISRAVDLVHSWLLSARASLRTELSLVAAAFPTDYLLRVMRGLWFVSTHGQDMEEKIEGIFRDFINIFSLIAIYRYSKLVLEPLIGDIQRDRGRYVPDLSPLTEAAYSLIKRWQECFAVVAPAALAVSLIPLEFAPSSWSFIIQTEKYLMTGTFPSRTLLAKEADALTTALHDQVFWTANAADFPRLPVASRRHPLHRILASINLDEAWPNWNLWDRFLCVFISLTAAAPFINQPSGQDDIDAQFPRAEQKSLLDFISKLNTLLIPPDYESSEEDDSGQDGGNDDDGGLDQGNGDEGTDDDDDSGGGSNQPALPPPPPIPEVDPFKRVLRNRCVFVGLAFGSRSHLLQARERTITMLTMERPTPRKHPILHPLRQRPREEREKSMSKLNKVLARRALQSALSRSNASSHHQA